MPQSQNINIQQESELQLILRLVLRNHKSFIFCIILALSLALIKNRYSVPTYRLSSSILIKGNNTQPGRNENDFLLNNMFGRNQNFQNELWILKSYPVVEKTVSNLNLEVSYFSKGRFNTFEIYDNAPFIVSFLPNHPQPINVEFAISFLKDGNFNIVAESKKVSFYNFEKRVIDHNRKKWNFSQKGNFGELIETSDLAFIIRSKDTTRKISSSRPYIFKFNTIPSISTQLQKNLEFSVVDRQATVINVSLETESTFKGMDILNELMNVYSDQNLERKNYLATITIDYIEKQLTEISDSLSLTEDNLQRFRSSHQLLNISDQATGISTQYLDLQNQLAELVSKKRYFDYVAELLKNDNFSNLMLPSAIGISDQLLNGLMTELMTAQAQRSNLIENNQERNPLVQKLSIQIENLKKNIKENISAVGNTTIISIDEMNKRIRNIEADINRLPATQRQLGTIERKYRLNETIYNYLMEKHSEAKISKASTLPDDIVIEPAKMIGTGPISPNKRMNYLLAFCLGLGFPFGVILIKSALNNKIETQEDIEKITDNPVLGKILHNKHKTNNVVYSFPNSNLSESFRALRTNLDFYIRGSNKKVILVSSCLEDEGKSFICLNLGTSYAQLSRKTILVDFDLRKSKGYFDEEEESQEGLSTYLIDKVNIEDIIRPTANEKLDYISSGIIPPNPVELLANDKVEKLIAELKNRYDIIIIDTPPLAQVTDTFLLINHSDLRLIVARQNVSLKRAFSVIMKDLHQKNIDKICIVLNDNKYYSDQYGYGYGYQNQWKKRKR